MPFYAAGPFMYFFAHDCNLQEVYFNITAPSIAWIIRESGPQFVLQSYIILRGDKKGFEDFESVDAGKLLHILGSFGYGVSSLVAKDKIPTSLN